MDSPAKYNKKTKQFAIKRQFRKSIPLNDKSASAHHNFSRYLCSRSESRKRTLKFILKNSELKKEGP